MYRSAAADVGGLRMLLCLAGLGGCMSLLPVHQSEFAEVLSSSTRKTISMVLN